MPMADTSSKWAMYVGGVQEFTPFNTVTLMHNLFPLSQVVLIHIVVVRTWLVFQHTRVGSMVPRKGLFGTEEDGHVCAWRLCTYQGKRQVHVLSSDTLSDPEEFFRGALSGQRLQ